MMTSRVGSPADRLGIVRRTMVYTACLFLLPAAALGQASVIIEIASEEPLSTTNPTYASWNVDSSCNRGFHQMNFTNPNLEAAASGLHPSKLRYVHFETVELCWTQRERWTP